MKPRYCTDFCQFYQDDHDSTRGYSQDFDIPQILAARAPQLNPQLDELDPGPRFPSPTTPDEIRAYNGQMVQWRRPDAGKRDQTRAAAPVTEMIRRRVREGAIALNILGSVPSPMEDFEGDGVQRIPDRKGTRGTTSTPAPIQWRGPRC